MYSQMNNTESAPASTSENLNLNETPEIVSTKRRQPNNQPSIEMNQSSTDGPSTSQVPQVHAKVKTNQNTNRSPKLTPAKKEFQRTTTRYALQCDVMMAMKNFSNSEGIRSVQEYYSRTGFKEEENCTEVYVTMEKEFPVVSLSEAKHRYLEAKTVAESTDAEEQNNRIPDKTPRMFLDGELLLSLNSSGSEVVEKAHELFAEGKNSINKTVGDSIYAPPSPDKNAEKEQRKRLYELGGQNIDENGESGSNLIRIPVLKVNVKDAEEAAAMNLNQLFHFSPVINFVDIQKWTNIDFGKFKLSNLIKCKKNLTADLLLQVPQPSHSNHTWEGKKTWKTFTIELNEVRASVYVNYLEKRETRGQRVLEKLLECKDDEERRQVEEEEVKSMIESRMNPLDSTSPHEDLELRAKEYLELNKLDKKLYFNAFFSNLNLIDEGEQTFLEQMQELEKLPEQLRPVHNGNLLNMIGKTVTGVNTVQVYVKTGGSRTDAHMEHLLVPSININAGPGVCIWYAVPYEYYGQIEKMVLKRRIRYHSQTYWPIPEDLEKEGIPVMKFVQGPGDMVYLNPGTYHWVQSTGETTNIAWNVAAATFEQLSISMIAHTHNLKNNFGCRVPLVAIAWKIAKEKLFMNDENVVRVVRSILIRTLAYRTWSLDELRKKGINVVHESELGWDTELNKNRTCEGSCGGELFDIIRWVKKRNEPVSYCSACAPKSKSADKFSFAFSEEELIQWIDDYKTEETTKNVSQIKKTSIRVSTSNARVTQKQVKFWNPRAVELLVELFIKEHELFEKEGKNRLKIWVPKISEVQERSTRQIYDKIHRESESMLNIFKLEEEKRKQNYEKLSPIKKKLYDFLAQNGKFVKEDDESGRNPENSENKPEEKVRNQNAQEIKMQKELKHVGRRETKRNAAEELVNELVDSDFSERNDEPSTSGYQEEVIGDVDDDNETDVFEDQLIDVSINEELPENSVKDIERVPENEAEVEKRADDILLSNEIISPKETVENDTALHDDIVKDQVPNMQDNPNSSGNLSKASMKRKQEERVTTEPDAKKIRNTVQSATEPPYQSQLEKLQCQDLAEKIKREKEEWELEKEHRKAEEKRKQTDWEDRRRRENLLFEDERKSKQAMEDRKQKEWEMGSAQKEKQQMNR